MNDSKITQIPKIYPQLKAKCKEIGFTMPSDLYIGSLLKTLVSSKSATRVLELGTGMSLSLCWMIDGLDQNSEITSIDNDPQLTQIAQDFFGNDPRVQILCEDGSNWLKNYQGEAFDLIFADAWPGKYSEIEETLSLVNIGGFYIIDDMSVQPNWPAGHEANVNKLISYLEARDDFSLTKMNWSTGIMMATRIE